MNEAQLDGHVAAMLRAYAGPGVPEVRARRTRRRVVPLVVAASALVIAVASAAAAVTGVLDGPSADPATKADIATSGRGAPPALDPQIDGSRAVDKLDLATAHGTVSLIVAPAARAHVCLGLELSWLGHRAGLGCDGPGGAPQPIMWGFAIPGYVGRSPGFVYGYVRDPATSRVVIALAGGGDLTLDTTDGFFLGEVQPGQMAAGITAYDAGGRVLAAISIPSPPSELRGAAPAQKTP